MAAIVGATLGSDHHLAARLTELVEQAQPYLDEHENSPAQALVNQALALDPECMQQHPANVFVHCQASLLALRRTDNEQSARHALAALALAKALGDGHLQAHARLAMARASLVVGDSDHTLAMLEASWPQVRDGDDLSLCFWYQTNFAIALAELDHGAESKDWYLQAAATAHTLGTRRLIALAAANLTHVWLDVGNRAHDLGDHEAATQAWQTAIDAADKWLPSIEQTGIGRWIAQTLHNRFAALGALGHTDEALAGLAQVGRLAAETDWAELLARAHFNAARILHRRGDLARAIDELRCGEAVGTAGQARSVLLMIYELASTVAEQAGDLPQALVFARRHHALHLELAADRAAMRSKLMAVRLATERAQAEAEMQRLRAEQAHRAAELLAQQRDRLEAMVGERTAQLATARDAAEAANRAKTAFLANMSHELRTPLNGILGMAELVRRRATDPKQIDQIGKLLMSGQHLLALVNDILDITQIEANRLRLQPQEVQLPELIDECLQMQEAAIAAKGLRVVRQIARELSMPLVGDATRIKQILINFTSNAVKFSRQGQIKVSANLVEMNDESVKLRLEVADEGIGIDAQDQARLFEPFYQVDDSFTRQYGGAGLGLRIAQRMAQLMDGEVGVSSQVGRGSVFWATIRLARVAASQAPRASAPVGAEAEIRRRFGGTRVLLAEDSPINQEVAIGMLTACGLQVDLATDGRQCVDKARQGDHALILIDLQMPVMNGIEAAREIRRLPGLASVPIVAMTSSAFAKDREACLAAGMDDYFAKPVHWGAAREAVLRLLDRPRCPPDRRSD